MKKKCPKCGKEKDTRGFSVHLEACKGILNESLSPDLQEPVDAVDKSRQDRAKMIRRAFFTRGWPNEEHKGTVRDFMIEHNIPVDKE